MKSAAFALALSLTALIAPSKSHALVQEIVNCTTSDGQYQINVVDNEGIGFVRTQSLSATITELSSDTVLASFSAEQYRGPQSISFGRPTYQDTSSSGKDFAVEGPSTNFRNYILNANVSVDGQIKQISDHNLNCSIFGGTLLQ